MFFQVPVCITMVIVIFLVKSISSVLQTTFSSTLIYQESETDAGVDRFLGSLLNAGIFVVAIVVVTIIFVILYKYRCMKVSDFITVDLCRYYSDG